jgi:hypothetical protein
MEKIFLLTEEDLNFSEAKRKKAKKPYSSITYTTGDIDLNIGHFNKMFGTDGLGDSAESAGDSEGGGLSEAKLQETKRYVRRYYIRPQNIFCSNKAEILKALIELDDENCSIYTLNNLGDEKDVSKLMTSDIIYYYDDGILYDKNKVKVMDYDLSIKKEENRKKFSSSNVPDKAFKDEYEDRMTDVTELEEAVISSNVAFSPETLCHALNRVGEVYLGYNSQDADVGTVEGEPYAGTVWYAGIDNKGEYYLYGLMAGNNTDYQSESPRGGSFENLESLYKAIAALEPLQDTSDLSMYFEEAFSLTFAPRNLLGESLETYTCCICGEEAAGYGNNPEPYKSKGKCCDACNLKFVIPARLEAQAHKE